MNEWGTCWNMKSKTGCHDSPPPWFITEIGDANSMVKSDACLKGPLKFSQWKRQLYFHGIVFLASSPFYIRNEHA